MPALATTVQGVITLSPVFLWTPVEVINLQSCQQNYSDDATLPIYVKTKYVKSYHLNCLSYHY